MYTNTANLIAVEALVGAAAAMTKEAAAHLTNDARTLWEQADLAEQLADELENT